MSVLMILVLISLAVVLVLTIAAVASSPPHSFQAPGRVQRDPARPAQLRRSTDKKPPEQESPSVIAAGFQ